MKSEADMTDALELAFNSGDLTWGEVRWVSTFDDSLMTRNKGVVVRFEDGSEYQITVVESRPSEEDEDEETMDDFEPSPDPNWMNP